MTTNKTIDGIKHLSNNGCKGLECDDCPIYCSKGLKYEMLCEAIRNILE